MPKVLSVIIGRKGSKGLPSKALLPLAGKPTAQWVMEWAISLNGKGISNKVVFSTDIEEFEPLCKDLGIEFIKRPQHLAGDKIRVEEVLYHAINEIGEQWDYLLLLYANVPLRYDDLVLEPIKFLEQNQEVKGVLTFEPVGKYNPSWMTTLNTKRLPKWEIVPFRRQDLTPLMIHDGHTLLTRWSWFKDFWANRSIKSTGQMYESFGNPLKPWVHDKLIVDIDNANDFVVAEALLRLGKQEIQKILSRISRRE